MMTLRSPKTMVLYQFTRGPDDDSKESQNYGFGSVH